MKIFILALLACSVQAFAAPQSYFQQEVRYEIEVALDPARHSLEGSEILHYTNNSPDTLGYVWFHLYPNAYKNERTPFAREWQKRGISDFYFSDEEERGRMDIRRIESLGQDLQWEYKAGDSIDEARVFLAQPLRPGETLEFRIDFSVKIPVTFSRLGHEGRNYVISQWYPKIAVYDREGWHPDSYSDQGEFYGDFGTFDVKITLPRSFVIDATGEIVSPGSERQFLDSIALETEKFLLLPESEREAFIERFEGNIETARNDSQTKTVHFHAGRVHDFAWFASESFLVRQRSYSSAGRTIPVYALFYPENASDWQFVPDYAVKTLELYGRWYGAYEYPKATVVDGSRTNSGGGMEYPMITVLTGDNRLWTRNLESIVVHELGHNWFYGMLGSDERRDAWLDEGINTFSERRYLETVYPPEGLLSPRPGGIMKYFSNVPDEKWLWQRDMSRTALTGRDQSLRLRAEEFSDDNYSAMVYAKGGFLIYALQNYLGERLFDSVMQEYFSRWKFRHPSTDDFIRVTEDITRRDMKAFFSQWLDAGRYADFTVDRIEESEEAGNYVSRVFLENKGDLAMPVDLALITEAGDTLVQKSLNEFIFRSSSPADRLIVNPGEKIYETNYLNNERFPRLNFNWFYTAMPSFTEYDINLFPFYWYDSYRDGHRPELYLFTGNPYTMRHKANIYTSYGFASGHYNFMANYAHRIMNFLSNDTRLGLGTQFLQGRKIPLRVNISMNWKPVEEHYTLEQRFFADLSRTEIYDLDYYEAAAWEEGINSKLLTRYTAAYRTMLYSTENTLSWKNGNNLIGGNYIFNRLDLSSWHSFLLSPDIHIDLRGFAGSISGNVPLQDRIYLAASNDPEFLHPVVFGRRGSSAPVNNYWIEGDANLRGYYGSFDGSYIAGRTAASLNLELYPMTLFGFDAGLFYDVGNVWNSFSEARIDALRHDAGLIFRGRLLDLAFPLWISTPAPGHNPWEFRWLLALKFSI